MWSITGIAEVRRRSGGAPAKKYGGLGAWGGAGSWEMGWGCRGPFIGAEKEGDRAFMAGIRSEERRVGKEC